MKPICVAAAAAFLLLSSPACANVSLFGYFDPDNPYNPSYAIAADYWFSDIGAIEIEWQHRYWEYWYSESFRDVDTFDQVLKIGLRVQPKDTPVSIGMHLSKGPVTAVSGSMFETLTATGMGMDAMFQVRLLARSFGYVRMSYDRIYVEPGHFYHPPDGPPDQLTFDAGVGLTI